MIAFVEVHIHIRVLSQRYLGYVRMHVCKAQAYFTVFVFLAHTYSDGFAFVDCDHEIVFSFLYWSAGGWYMSS